MKINSKFKHGSRLIRLSSPLRAMVHKSLIFILISAAISFMVLDKNGSATIEKTSVVIADIFSPILDFISRPAASINQVLQDLDNLSQLHKDNSVLRAENKRLNDWKMIARDLRAQNKALKTLLGYTGDLPPSQITARVIGDAAGPFVRTLIINVGTDRGIKKGNAVISGEGLIGRVIAAGKNSARILLITDINSRVPVLVESSRDRAILTGTNAGQPKLSFLPASADLAEGDRVVTSGHGGVLPAGLPVGTILNAGDGNVLISTFARLDRLEYVRVVVRDKIISPDLN